MSVKPSLTLAEIKHELDTAGFCNADYKDLPSSLGFIERVTEGLGPEKLDINVKRLKIYWRVRIAWKVR